MNEGPLSSASETPPRAPWHALSSQDSLAHLGCGPGGLSHDEAQSRLARYGPNRLPPPRRRGPLRRLLVQFHNVLIYVLLGAGAVTTALGHWVDAGVIFGVVVINALIGFIQEGKAERALDAVRSMLSPQAVVTRDGHRRTIPADRLVPGDVVHLQSGDRAPAELRLLRVKNLRVDESILTGESQAVEKSTEPVAEGAPLGDRRSMAYSGTLVTFGQGTGVVVATGVHTEVGRISELLARVQTLTTPLLRQLGQFARWLTGAIGIIAGAAFVFGVTARDYAADEMFLAVVGLAVAAIPEGLPAIITITLAVGVQRMARRNAIIRRLPAVETLGSVSTICSDKTGTLTRNEMTVRTAALASERLTVSGVGYEPRGGFSAGDRDISPSEHVALQELCKAALLCNDASIELRDGQWVVDGDPTEGALVAFALKAGLERHLLEEEYPRTDLIPFESEHRFMATLHHDHAGHGFLYLKGAPETVLPRCAWQRLRGEDRPLDPVYWERELEVIAGHGQRTLALAFKVAALDQRTLYFADADGGFTLLGLVGIIDPPREEAIHAVRECQAAGIRVKMITGDHVVTARAVAEQMGIGDGRTTLTGAQLSGLDGKELATAAESCDVFARTSPEHKLRLVMALQAWGHVVAMTGDGVNDAPALKRADVGVAMGVKGTEAAKEAAEMVLADDNFASIVNAVEEGRTIYDNIKKSVLFILPTNGGEALTILAAIALGRVLPVTPAQILWVNMITAVTLALALAFEPPELDIMRRPPRDPREAILSGFMAWRIAFVSTIMVIATFGLFLWEREQGLSVDGARTVAVNTLVMLEIYYLFTTRYLRRNVLNRAGLLGNRSVLVAVGVIIPVQVLFTHSSVMQTLFHTEALDIWTWVRIVVVSASVLVFVELEKWLMRRFSRSVPGRAAARGS
ncbi:MAG: cation-transporting P-type ATPase [Gammaproteobacteria bacterium]|nr:cation-transporting P-type ATPase [Gammaproteobacteria bacterium]NIR83541.1 cation-transporting P-type ATPase [Gammaproteobacteria bacterium]NIR91463.1 cation-transporting P-type ATPase [Gammaproteobacteria bacterium]NIU04703.1 cation-transporting P-type ATPase [Gammaproteobacteria bacterium]NIV51745.1 HAD-IC family P-type ATPase [Gammaproteobacteria bacterium]